MRQRGLDSVATRAVVPAMAKLVLLLRAFRPLAWKTSAGALPVIAEVQFLIDAVAAAPLPLREPDISNPWWRFGPRAIWVIELFDRLEREERRRQLERLALPRPGTS